ncbi:MAG: NADH-quinone oxidoreductase subunit H [Planctomycetes bacterium]|nr:NADH-quinone oxidoreductase subunit H [Planctomycetota bacterium]
MSISTPDWLAHIIAALVQCALLLAIALCSAAVGIWLERKVSARIQDRLGPTRVGGRFGWLQPPADGLKLICKEDIIPAAADHILFRIAPYISFCAVFCVFLALPFANGWVAVELNAGAFFLLAVAGLEIFGVILGGYASGSKWSLYGAMREAAQVVSYEIPLGLCVVVIILLTGTMNLVAIGNQQAGWFFNWHIFHDPFTFVTFWVYVTCAVASSNRAPFDLPEAESELVAGFLTEYSGFRWVFFFMGEYASMFVVSALGALLFLGGWNGPVPIASLLGLTPEHGAIGGWINTILGPIISMLGLTLDPAAWIGNLLGMCNFIAKAFLGMTFMIWLRWTLPRLRIDQVITTCLKYCVPIVSAMLAGVMLWSFFLPGGLFAALTQPASFPRSAWERTDSTLRVDGPQDVGEMQEEAGTRNVTALRSHAEHGNEGNIQEESR